MKQNEIDMIEIFGTVASVAAVIIIFYVLKHPTNKPIQKVIIPGLPATEYPDISSGENNPSIPNYDDEDTVTHAANIVYNIAGDDISSDFCSSCKS